MSNKNPYSNVNSDRIDEDLKNLYRSNIRFNGTNFVESKLFPDNDKKKPSQWFNILCKFYVCGFIMWLDNVDHILKLKPGFSQIPQVLPDFNLM